MDDDTLEPEALFERAGRPAGDDTIHAELLGDDTIHAEPGDETIDAAFEDDETIDAAFEDDETIDADPELLSRVRARPAADSRASSGAGHRRGLVWAVAAAETILAAGLALGWWAARTFDDIGDLWETVSSVFISG